MAPYERVTPLCGSFTQKSPPIQLCLEILRRPHRRCLVPINNFFEWKAVKGSPKQPYAIGMKSAEPFALAGIWENWKRPETEESLSTFALITTNSNACNRQRDFMIECQ